MSLRHWSEIRSAAYDCILVKPCKFGSPECTNGTNTHGRHGVDMAWYSGKSLAFDGRNEGLAVVQFVLFTGWYRDETVNVLKHDKWTGPLPADLGFHSPYPMWADQESVPCHLNGKECYYDGSGLNAEDPWRVMRHEGEDAFWKFMDSYWRDLFEAVR